MTSRDEGPGFSRDGDSSGSPTASVGTPARSPFHSPDIRQTGVDTIAAATLSSNAPQTPAQSPNVGQTRATGFTPINRPGTAAKSSFQSPKPGQYGATASPSLGTPSPAQIPGIQQNGVDTLLPAAVCGFGHHPPGALAARIKQLDYARAYYKNTTQLKTNALVVMSQMPAQREPLLRPGKVWKGVDLERHISSKLENIESALLQVVGNSATKACNACERGCGPWSECVVLLGCADLTACAGCRFRGMDARCTFYRPPADPAEDEGQQDEFEDVQGEIDTLQQRSNLHRINLDEANQAIGRLQEQASEGKVDLVQACNTMTTLAETLSYLQDEISRAAINYRRLHRHYMTLHRAAEGIEPVFEEDVESDSQDQDQDSLTGSQRAD